MASFTDETRRRLATGWDPRACTAREYARQNGVSERAIRNWRRRFGCSAQPSMPPSTTSVPLQTTVDALQARLGDLELAVDAARAALAACRAALAAVAVPEETGGPVERRPDGDKLVVTVETRAAPPVARTPEAEALRPVPMPSPGFSWFR
jgi:transposase-like protein